MPSDDHRSDIQAALSLLFEPDHVFEIRVLGEDGVSSGYFADHERAVAEIRAQDADKRVSGIYVTLNEVRPDLLARRSNRIKYRIGKKDSLTADADIIARRWLPIDIDPQRPSGISSSAQERADAVDRADSIASFLRDLGWPEPVIADSGNGAHLLYRIDLPNDAESRDLIKKVLEFLDLRFSDTRCKVDCANFNAARIWKMYGTVTRKGDNIAERPHRRSGIIAVPDPVHLVTRTQLQALLSLYPSAGELERVEDTGEKPEGQSLDLGAWLERHGIRATPRPYQGGTLYVLEQCPFSEAHTDGAFAIQFANGAIFAGCHHDSCGGGAQRWFELRARYEPEKADVGARLARLRSSRIRDKMEAEGRLPNTNAGNVYNAQAGAGSAYQGRGSGDRDGYHASVLTSAGNDAGENSGDDGRDDPRDHRRDDSGGEPGNESRLKHLPRAAGSEPGDEESRISRQTSEVLRTGSPLRFLLETFARSHEGDQTVAECLIHSLASRLVLNSKGLHVSITGESGKGKSHAIEVMRTLIPERYRLDGRLSDKALFYMEDLAAGSVITLDDMNLSDQMQEILKGVTTSFQKPFVYRTVNKDRKGHTCRIPERCVWWVAKVEGTGDDQVFNRMLTCWIDDTEEQDLRVLDRTLAGAEQMPGAPEQCDDQILVCREIWEQLQPVFVVIPFASRIRFQSSANRRNPDMLLDLIRTNAILNQCQRECGDENGVKWVKATREDFDQAARLFSDLNTGHGGQENKLTRREMELIEIMQGLGNTEVPLARLQKITGWSNGVVGKLIHGYRSYGKSYTGLLEKCPAISFTDRAITRGDEGYTTQRRDRVYIWDAEVYEVWLKGGQVWLADEEGSGPDESGGDPDCPSEDDGQSHVNPGEAGGHDLIQPGEVGRMSDQERAGADGCKPAGISLVGVKPGEYVRIDGMPVRRSCSVCGKRKVRYEEKEGSDRGAEGSRHKHVLCASCYQRAVSREVAAIIPLPGVIDPGQLVRRSTPSGRCQVCDLLPAVWSDPRAQVHICDTCFQRVVDATMREADPSE